MRSDRERVGELRLHASEYILTFVSKRLLSNPHPERDDLTLTGVLFALSDPERLAIAQQLIDGPLDMASCSVTDPDMPKSTKSHLMKVLRESGVIRNDPNGRRRILSLRRDDLDARCPGVLDAVLDAAGPPPAHLEPSND